MKIGCYRIVLGGRYFWFQTEHPVVIKRFLGIPFIWILKEVKLGNWDKSPQFPLGTEIEYEGKRYLYCKLENEELRKVAYV